MTKNTNEQLIQDNYRNVYALAHSLAKSYNLAFEAFEDLQKVGYISLMSSRRPLTRTAVCLFGHMPVRVLS